MISYKILMPTLPEDFGDTDRLEKPYIYLKTLDVNCPNGELSGQYFMKKLIKIKK